MRLLHTADWHLGRVFYAYSLLEDQAHLLDQLVQVVADTKPDAVLIAGDVYDRAVAPPEAVSLLDDILSRIVVGLHVPVVLIAGNHDSADRVGFGARLMASGGLCIAGRVGAQAESVTLSDAHGEVVIYALPYGEPAVVRDAFATNVHDHETAMRLRLDAIRARHPAHARSVLVGHAFVSGGRTSESERPLSVGGSGAVGVDLFDGFDYVALGHLHRPQTLIARLRYAGSLLKYSLSEIDHRKSISLVELGARGDLRIEELALTPRRDFRLLEGTLEALLEGARTDASPHDYVYARLLDEGALLDPRAKLQALYPQLASVERVVTKQSGALAVARARRERTPSELFHEFFAEVTGEPLGTAREAQLALVLERVANAERETK